MASEEIWTFKPGEGWRIKELTPKKREMDPHSLTTLEERMVEFMRYLLNGLVPEELMKEFTEEVEHLVHEDKRAA